MPILHDLHPNRVVDRMRIRAILERMLEENPESDYPRLLEMDAEGLSSREGAEELGISVAKSEKRKQRARARFRDLQGELHGVRSSRRGRHPDGPGGALHQEIEG